MESQIITQEIAGSSNPQKLVKSNPVNIDAQITGNAKLRDITHKNTGLSSLCPWYSKKQLRRVHRIQVRRYKYGHGNVRYSDLNRADVSSVYILDVADDMEAVL